MKTLTITIIALTVLTIGVGATFADNMWSETPDPDNFKAAPFISEKSRLSNKPVTTDLWAETPTLDDDNDALDFYNEKVGLKAGLAHPELYAETPDLKKVSPAKMNRRPPNDVMVAELNNEI